MCKFHSLRFVPRKTAYQKCMMSRWWVDMSATVTVDHLLAVEAETCDMTLYASCFLERCCSGHLAGL